MTSFTKSLAKAFASRKRSAEDGRAPFYGRYPAGARREVIRMPAGRIATRSDGLFPAFRIPNPYGTALLTLVRQRQRCCTALASGTRQAQRRPIMPFPTQSSRAAPGRRFSRGAPILQGSCKTAFFGLTLEKRPKCLLNKNHPQGAPWVS